MDPKVLTTAYLYMLAHTAIDSKKFEEINSLLRKKLEGCSSRNKDQAPSDIVKAVLVDKLTSIQGVDKLCILDESGYQFETLGMRVNGVGPVTVLIISEQKGGHDSEDHR
jgi:hypothetical protein